ncbi:inactive all-trans-retinol 13,14-reductase-like [Megalops cyprinoides]|uniref:inactive all-trans-retinol 13,14-reductase-like n=1 Tax=Megalops cyprinoides TaxID=118141 RepID=UPI001863C22D|nr:inactive all-trans-retinol 13,14-reductase-like [Megalops cyprinoides]
MWLLILAGLLVLTCGTYRLLFGKRSPFSLKSVRPPGPRVTNQELRDKVLKQGFSADKVPKDLDAIVIGSGIGGLTAAATLAKLGKRVLVLEQQDQAGGLCHTYPEKGFEFDVGLYNIGQLHENSLLRVALDQITEGQIELVELEHHIDTIIIGEDDDRRDYHIYTGKTEMAEHLKKQFPNDTEAIDVFFEVMKITAKKTWHLVTLKLIPLWLALFLLKHHIAQRFSSIFKLSCSSVTEVVSTLTSNKDLHVIFSYIFYGVPPRDSSTFVNALLLHHYKRGAYYLRGGASEIPFHIIPVIQKPGGNVLVRAPVTQILVNKKGAAYGVTVKKGQEEVEVLAPVVISNTGLFTTFQKLLPPEVQAKPEIQDRLGMLKHGRGSFFVLVGFDATEEELEIVPINYWLFKNNDMDSMMDNFFSLSKEEVAENIPMMSIMFPSTKEPTAKVRFPGKSSMILQTMVNYEWFDEWKDSSVEERGGEYYNYKMSIANKLFDWACMHFPKIRDKVAFMDAVVPLQHDGGDMYSEHNLTKFKPEAIARNRCSTPVKNLFITGQDVFVFGIPGALQGGLLCASTVLNNIVHIDLQNLKKNLKRQKAKELAKFAKKLQ